jgi:hypothetical protein
MKPETAVMLWEIFVEEVRRDVGISTPLVNFLGSVKKHQDCFKRALTKLNELQDNK